MGKEISKASPMQQLAYFNDNTNLYKVQVDSQAGSENGTIKFKYDDTKLLAKSYLLVEATLTATHANSSTYTPHEDGPFNFIKRLSLMSHLGFRSFDVSGKMLKLMNFANLGDTKMTTGTTSTSRKRIIQGLSASSGGTANKVKFLVELPNVVNDRDLAGLILLQNKKVNIQLELQLGTVSDLAPASSGYTFALSAITVSLYADLFNIPENLEMYPMDLIRVVKLCHEQQYQVINGENTIKLTTGNTFRKIFMQFQTSSDVRSADSTLGDFYLIVGGTNYKYRISPYMLAEQNQKDGYDLPYGTFALDFSSGQGLMNLSGRRDYINTDELTELWIRFTSSATGNLLLGTETLTTLK